MKNSTYIAVLFFLSQLALAQNVGINPGGTTPNASAILDLNTGNTYTGTNGKGLLIPNVTLSSTADATTIGNGNVNSLLVYNTTAAGAGATAVFANTYYYWNGAKWVTFSGQGSNDWSLTGNAGTTVGTNFLGTTDSVDLEFKVNNQMAGLLNMGNQQTYFGHRAGYNSNSSATLGTLIGYKAGTTLTSGAANTALGFSALRNNSTGGDNTMVGVDAGYYLSNSYNTSVGMWSLEGSAIPANNTGVANTALGFCAGGGYNGVLGVGTNNYLQTTSGSYNTFLGYSTEMAAGTYSNTTTLGAFAQVGQSDAIILGGVAGVNGATNNVKVGIGTSTPSYPFHLYGSTNGNTYMVNENANAGVSTIAAVVAKSNAGLAGFQITSTAGGSWAEFGTSGTGGFLYSIWNNTGDHAWRTTALSTERMRLTSAGNLGIGTSTPEVTLHVATEATVANPRCMIDQYCATNSNSAFFILRKGRGTILAPTIVVNGDQLGTVLSEAYDGTAFIRTGASMKFTCNGVVGAGSIPTDIFFTTGSSGIGTEWMRITSAGLVGIATSAPTAALSVNGAANNTTGVWAIFSDSRIKTINADFKDGLAIIKQIHPVKFTYNNNAPFKSGQEQIGIVAQEL